MKQTSSQTLSEERMAKKKKSKQASQRAIYVPFIRVLNLLRRHTEGESGRGKDSVAGDRVATGMPRRFITPQT